LDNAAAEMTIVLHDPKEMVNKVIENFLQLKTNMDTCVGDQGAAVTINAKPIWEGMIALKNRAIRTRWITDITKENIDYCKEIMKVAEIRHLDGIKGAFGVHDGRHYFASANVTKGDSIFPGELIVSNVRVIVEQQQQIFNLLWDKEIPSKHRIREIEHGLKREFMDTYRDPNDILNLVFSALNSATDDIKIIFPSHAAFNRFVGIGILVILKKSVFEHDVDVKILANLENGQEGWIPQITKEISSAKYDPEIQDLPICFRPITAHVLHTKITTLIADSEFSLTVEVKDNGDNDANEGFEESVGMATYSNNQSTVDSYSTIFENLWAKAGSAT
jgi:hypothetical protein